MRSSPNISIIVPALNEARAIVATLAPLQCWRAQGHEIILVDGGSLDATCALAAPLVDALIPSAPGRALQMNAGAHASRGELLLFLHADTLLPTGAAALLEACLGRACWGRFDVRLSGTRWLLRVVEWSMNWRSRLSGIATGDQTIFVDRATFMAVGGFPQLPLMEDIALSKLLRQRMWPINLSARVTTSSRRWEQHGIVRTILRMWWLRYCFWRGDDAATLAPHYAAVRDRA